MGQGPGELREAMHAALLQRRNEIELVLHTRVYALADSSETVDPEYREGLRAAVVSALDYGLAVVRSGADSAPPIPAPLLTQVKLAARNRIGLDTVLRRYFAGYTLLSDFLLREATKEGSAEVKSLPDLIRSLAAPFDRLLAEVSAEYVREERNRADPSTERRRGERIERLLAGELLDTSQFAYDFEGCHLGLIASGPGAEATIRSLAVPLGCRLLLLCRGEETVWAWLGSRREIDPALLHADACASAVGLAVGEPGRGLSGWRLTHRQASAALTVATRSPGRPIRYADVALLSSMLQDELLTASLRDRYLKPLQAERDGGRVARQTLRAYFAAGRNVSSAAAALGVSRNTVANRLRAIEESISVQLDSCAAELEVALQLANLSPSSQARALPMC